MEELRLKIIELINTSGLPIEAAYFVVKDVFRDVEATFTDFKNSQQIEPKEENE